MEDRIIAWLGSVQTRFVNAAKQRQISLFSLRSIPVAVRDESGNGVGVGEEKRKFSSFRENAPALHEAAGPIEDREAVKLADELARTYSNPESEWLPTAKLWSPERARKRIRESGIELRSDENRAIHILDLLHGCVLEMLETGSSFGRSTLNWRRVAASALVNHLKSGVVPTISRLPISGLTNDKRVSRGVVTVRPMTPEELGNCLENFASGSGIFYRWRGGTERHVLEVESAHTVEEHRLSEGGGLEPTLLSFALHGYNIGTTFHATVESTPGWLLLGMRRAGPPVGLPDSVQPEGEKAISTAHLNSIEKLAASMMIQDMTKAQDVGGFALRRFQLGASRNNSSDALVDFVVSLESILLREQGEGEMAHRFRTNGAYLLGSSYQEREDISVRLNKVYGARSRLVHGPRPGGKKQQRFSSAEIASLSIDARQLAKKAILRGIDRGWPDAGYFRRISLGG